MSEEPTQVTSLSHAAWIARSLGRGELAPLDEDDIAHLAAELGETRYAGGTFVFREQQAPARVHVVRDGLIELTLAVHGRRVTVQLLRPGDVFGDVPLLLRMQEAFDARAREDSLVLSIGGERLFQLLRDRPGVAQRWLVSLAERMAGIERRLLDLLAGGLDAQVATTLLREGVSGRVALSQEVLAELLGARRSSVNRVLRALQDRGLVELRYRDIRLLDPQGLAAIASG
jgi:CRP-like cAMP-binding protein